MPPKSELTAVLPCGCESAIIRTKRCFYSIADEEQPQWYEGFTCECSQCFYTEPRTPNDQIKHGDENQKA